MRVRLILSTRSATAPPNGPAKIEGRNSAAAIRPSHAPEWVSAHVSQPTATRWIHGPISEKTLPEVQGRKFRFEKPRGIPPERENSERSPALPNIKVIPVRQSNPIF